MHPPITYLHTLNLYVVRENIMMYDTSMYFFVESFQRHTHDRIFACVGGGILPPAPARLCKGIVSSFELCSPDTSWKASWKASAETDKAEKFHAEISNERPTGARSRPYRVEAHQKLNAKSRIYRQTVPTEYPQKLFMSPHLAAYLMHPLADRNKYAAASASSSPTR